jgi:hypothetical protein
LEAVSNVGFTYTRDSDEGIELAIAPKEGGSVGSYKSEMRRSREVNSSLWEETTYFGV